MAAKKNPDLKPGRGVIARDGNGYLGVITTGPKKIVIDGESKDLWHGLHLLDDRSRKIGDLWTSFRPTVVCRADEIA